MPQVTWIGYPNTTGLRTVDYRFTDELCDPLDTAQLFVEELVRLQSCFLCYTPVVAPPPVTLLPATANGFVTFGSFNALAKITQEVRAGHSKLESRSVIKRESHRHLQYLISLRSAIVCVA